MDGVGGVVGMGQVWMQVRWEWRFQYSDQKLKPTLRCSRSRFVSRP